MEATESPQVRQEQQVSTTSSSRFAPDSIITGLIGLVMVVVGLIAVTRAGFDGPMSEPVIRVFGFTYTSTLGLIEIGLGLCLLLSAAARSRSGELFFGAVLGIAGFVGAIQTESFRKSLALEPGMGWLAVAAGSVIVVAALLLPRISK
ncbi:MAG: hypothetical protein ABI590_08015, partial [Ilumatobacteraceae bacterium]